MNEPIRIDIDDSNDEVRAKAVSALVKDPELFIYGGSLVRVVDGDGTADKHGTPLILRPDEYEMFVKLDTLADFFKLKRPEKGGEPTWVRVKPPRWVCKSVLSCGRWDGIRKLNGLATAPAIRANGTVMQTPGFDEASGVFYVPNADYPEVPERPSPDDAGRAVSRLLDVIVDFPLTEQGKAGWLAMLFSMVARDMVNGGVPLFAIDAHTAGSGKSLLVKVAHWIAHGTSLPCPSMPPDDEEMRKQITANLLGGDRVMMFDNVRRSIGGESLEALVTSATWKSRVLGTVGNTKELPNRMVVCATGNALKFRGDMGRRTLTIRLDTDHQNPEERTDFKRADRAGENALEMWVRRNRASLVVDALTCLRAWVVAGRGGSAAKWGSFTSWSAVIAQCVTWLGLPDPATTRVTSDINADEELYAWATIYDAIEAMAKDARNRNGGKEEGVRIRDVVDKAFTRDGTKGDVVLAEAIDSLMPPQIVRSDSVTKSRVLGSRLAEGRIVEGKKLVRVAKSSRARYYSVHPLPPFVGVLTGGIHRPGTA